ncbi:hypothetical protein RsoM2USA_198 [Ralstonia phage RsoM2USA]|nr:hypothetical protein RsoM2USA_198 [Ralstonia phage RsoM2USA]
MIVNTAETLLMCQLVFELENEETYDVANQVYSSIIPGLRHRFIQVDSALDGLLAEVRRIYEEIKKNPVEAMEKYPANMAEE